MAKIENLKASMEKALAKVEKTHKTIERHEKQLAKKWAILEGMGADITLPIDELKWDKDGHSTPYYWETCDVETKRDDIKSAHKKLADAERILNNWQGKLAKEQERDHKINTDVPQVIIEFVDKWGELAKEWTRKNIKNISEEKIIELIEDEKRFKILDLVYRTERIAGKITDASELKISESGNLNGIIQGEDAKVEMNTIMAGGWNIQRFHYRTLVHRI